ncbi:MAG: hypothetical protein ACOY4U_05590 [Pseudomonadota bacterium]
MKRALISSVIMLSAAQFSAADTGTTPGHNADQRPAESKIGSYTAPASEVLSDDFMRDVSDGSSAGEGGEREQEQSGETIGQTLRVNEKSALH